MMLSAVLFATVGVLAFQTASAVSSKERKQIKYIHGGILTFATIFAFLGLYPVYAVRGFKLTIAHTWIGYAALFMMLQNYTLGILKFVFKFQIWEYCLGHVNKGAGVLQTYVPTHRTLGLVTIILLYAAAISGVYHLAGCGSASGCGGGTLLLMLLVTSLLFVMGSLHPQFLYPENLCTNCLDKIEDWCKACCAPAGVQHERRHNSADGDAADNLLPRSAGDYGSTDGGVAGGTAADDLSTSGSSYDSDGQGHRLPAHSYHQTSLTQRNPVISTSSTSTSSNGVQLPIGGPMVVPARSDGTGTNTSNTKKKSRKKSSRTDSGSGAPLVRENLDDPRYGAV